MLNKASAADFAVLVGRILVSMIFVVAGFVKATQFAATAAVMAKAGIPMSEILLVVAICLELGGGLMVMLGYKARFGAIMLIVFVLLATFVFHSFWSYEGSALGNQVYHFLKNFGVIGAMLFLVAHGPGALSVDQE